MRKEEEIKEDKDLIVQDKEVVVTQQVDLKETTKDVDFFLIAIKSEYESIRGVQLAISNPSTSATREASAVELMKLYQYSTGFLAGLRVAQGIFPPENILIKLKNQFGEIRDRKILGVGRYEGER